MKQKNIKNLVKYFNTLVENTLFKLKDKTNNFFSKKSKISNFNKLIITFISLLFFYLFYLSIPTLYNKTWVQNTIEDKLFKEFKINFSISSNISYNILPKPHFLIKDSKIFKDGAEKTTSLSEIKNLKIFISQKKFLNKEKMHINKVTINKANFSLLSKDFKLLNNASNNRFSNKKINISNSNIFYKDDENKTIAIIKISKASFFFDKLKKINLFDLKGEVFNIPFSFDLNKDIYSSKKKEIHISANKLKLNILNDSKKENGNLIKGTNIISVLNSKIYTEYKLEDGLIKFKSINSRIQNSKINYKGIMSINPFDLNLDINLENYKLSKLLNINSIIGEFIKTNALFNENISVSSSVSSKSSFKEEIFDTFNINFNIVNGKINFDKTKLTKKKIGFLNINNSNLFFENDNLILNTDILIDIKNFNNLYSFFQTSKQFRKPIEKIFINLDYNFLTSEIKFNNLAIDGNIVEDQVISIIEEFNDNKDGTLNLNKSRRILNKFFATYAG